ncbi:MAG: tellurite resistance TerB family protein [Bacteroides sp.]|nr:tellurite resistance TerB family protein [Bacteroides sp.]
MGQIAYADGEIDITERELLKRYIEKMNFAEENIEEIADFILDSVKEGVSVDEIISNVTNQ